MARPWDSATTDLLPPVTVTATIPSSSFAGVSTSVGGFRGGGGAGTSLPPQVVQDIEAELRKYGLLPAEQPATPQQAFVAPTPNPFVEVLPEVTVVARASKLPSFLRAVVTLARRFPLLSLLIPTNLAQEPSVVRLKPRVDRTPAEETTLPEQVVTAPRKPSQKVGKTTSVDYFAPIYQEDLDLVSNITLDATEPTPWTIPSEPSLAPSPSPSPSPRTYQRPTTEPWQAWQPLPSAPPRARPAAYTLPLPSTSPTPDTLIPTPSPFSQPWTPGPTFQPQKRPKTGSKRKPKVAIDNPLTFDLTQPQEAPVESSPKADKCKCPKCSKTSEKKKDRKTCYVTLTKEHRNRSDDVVKRWRKIQCQ